MPYSILHTLAIGDVTHLRCSAILQHGIVLGKLFRLEKFFVLLYSLSFSQLSGSDRPRCAELCDVPVAAAAGKQWPEEKEATGAISMLLLRISSWNFFLISLKDLPMCRKKLLLIFWHNQITFQFILLLNYILGLYSSVSWVVRCVYLGISHSMQVQHIPQLSHRL